MAQQVVNIASLPFPPKMASMIKKVFFKVCLSCSISPLLTSIVAASTNPPLVPYKSIAPQVEATMENTALVALEHIAKARSEIHRGAVADARVELTQALRLMGTIRDRLSTAPAMHLIRIAPNHLDVEAPSEVLRDLPPIYRQLNDISTYLPGQGKDASRQVQELPG